MKHQLILMFATTLLANKLPAAQETATSPGTAGSGPPRGLQTSGTNSRPNIIIMMSDDMGFSDIGCYGGEIQTPNLDSLANNGVRFTQFYNTARCCPTRASLLTGLHPHQAGIGHMMEDRGLEGYRGNLNHQCVTIPEALKSAGYRSYAVGKWHVTPGHTARTLTNRFNWPLQRGFDRYYGTIHGAGSYWDPSALVRDNNLITPFNDPEYPSQNYFYTDAISDHAVRFITEHARDHGSVPFFMYVAYTAAHWPLHAKEPDIAKYKGRYDSGYQAIRNERLAKQVKLGLLPSSTKPSPTVGDWNAVKNREFETRCMEVYAATIDCMDQGVGRILATLKQEGKLENTVIMFLQDNGGCAEPIGRGPNAPQRSAAPTLSPMSPAEFQFGSIPKQTRDGYPVRQGYGVMPGPKDTYISYGREWANVSNTPFREYKHWVHEGGISTPLIVHWPAGLPKAQAGKLVRDPAQLPDIMATCIEVAQASYPSTYKGNAITPLEGRSFLAAARGQPSTRDALYWEHEGNRAVRMGDWKLVAKGPQAAWELYNLAVDRTELNDLASQEPARVQAMSAKWNAWAHRAKVLPWPWDNSDPNDAPPSRKTSFKLGPSADLPRSEAPDYTDRGFSVNVRVDQCGSDGVLVAHGGDAHGWAMYFQGGDFHFVMNRNRQLEDISSRAEALRNATNIVATLSPDATLTVTADGKQIVQRPTRGLLRRLPVDGLQVGSDAAGTVGDYSSPFPFNGKIGEVTITLTPRN